ncbi:winged helix-turn-helix domain-containing protein [Vulcaniibacterium gelatinicum]|uniref:winged helix-turn-helix domain-containing protein n=1 Tax=Vulcaniibacterium gelatinicum TaxID=2598725 RepID=UPI0011C75834|nr:winged helix-turn-helix domain-containing protein [Vulcaniibacterium gelatinicum]
MDALAPSVYAFAGFRLDPRTRLLYGPDGAPVHLGGKAVEVLLYLVEHADRVVGKDELLEQVWAGRVVEENTLTQAVSALRKALGTGAGDHRFILTVPGRGYRFVAALESPQAAAAGPPTWPTPRLPPPPRWRRAVLAALMAVVPLLLVASRPKPPLPAALTPRTVAAPRNTCDGGNTPAARAYLEGRYLMGRLHTRRYPLAFAALDRAIRLDPSCARAWAALATLHVSQALGADAEPRVAFPRARLAVGRALVLDPDLAEAWVAKGQIEAWFDWNWTLARASFERALALDPNSPEAHRAYALAIAIQDPGSPEWMQHNRRAHELDPLAPAPMLTLANSLAESDPKAADALIARVLELEPDYWHAYYDRAGYTLSRGRPRDAIPDLLRAVEYSHGHAWTVAELAKVYLAIGERERAVALLRELEARDRTGYVPATALARIHAALGDTERAMDALERAYEERDPRIAYFTLSRSFASLHSHPRFRALAARLARETSLGASPAEAAPATTPKAGDHQIRTRSSGGK